MSKGTAIVVSSGLGLVALVLFLVFVIQVANQSGGNALGDETFDVNASALATQIAQNGPILFPDLLGRGRDIYVQHLSEDRTQGWRAFRATAPGAERPCTLRWEPAERLFRDPCAPDRTYPPDGEGLEQYRATVEEGNKLVVDLRRTAP